MRQQSTVHTRMRYAHPRWPRRPSLRSSSSSLPRPVHRPRRRETCPSAQEERQPKVGRERGWAAACGGTFRRVRDERRGRRVHSCGRGWTGGRRRWRGGEHPKHTRTACHALWSSVSALGRDAGGDAGRTGAVAADWHHSVALQDLSHQREITRTVRKDEAAPLSCASALEKRARESAQPGIGRRERRRTLHSLHERAILRVREISTAVR